MNKLAVSEAMRNRLREQGVADLLNVALQGDDTDNEMHHYSINLLWQLGADDCVSLPSSSLVQGDDSDLHMSDASSLT